MCTLSLETIACMPCNPAIGGTAKGQLVREIDALGGLMGLAIDATGLQFKVLNRSRGPAVWAPRAQADKKKYSEWMKARIAAVANLVIVEGHVAKLLVESGRVVGVSLLDGSSILAACTVVTTGTFLNGLIHVGDVSRPAGRAGEAASVFLGEHLKALGLKSGRLKTGTPPRLSRASIDFGRHVSNGLFHVEHGDDVPSPLSFMTATRLENTISCWRLHSSEQSHAVVRQSIQQSPLYNGRIAGIGPRVLPVVRGQGHAVLTEGPTRNPSRA